MNATTIGQRVRQARQAQGLTIEQLARQAGVTQRAVSEIERERTRCPQAATLTALAAALAVTPTWLDTTEPIASSQLAIGQRLRACRADRGLTQAQLAQRAAVSAHTLSRLERTVTSPPRATTLVRLATALDVDPAWLRSGEPEAPSEL
jgi:transcriptional regulator with XRE-family HTH domain